MKSATKNTSGTSKRRPKSRPKSRAKSHRHSRPTRVTLAPSRPPVAAPTCGRDLKWTSITVGKHGTLDQEPALLDTCTGDFVAWIILNDSGRRLKLKLKDFKRRPANKTISPIDWIDESVDIADGAAGIVAGQVVYEVAKDETAVVKYTIEVRGPGSIDYDPELQIRQQSM